MHYYRKKRQGEGYGLCILHFFYEREREREHLPFSQLILLAILCAAQYQTTDAGNQADDWWQCVGVAQ